MTTTTTTTTTMVMKEVELRLARLFHSLLDSSLLHWRSLAVV